MFYSAGWVFGAINI